MKRLISYSGANEEVVEERLTTGAGGAVGTKGRK